MKLTGQKKTAFLKRMAAGRKAAARKNPKTGPRKKSIRKAKKSIGKAFTKPVAAAWAKAKRKAARGRRNPDEMAEAIQMFEDFHGRAPSKITEYEQTQEYRSELAELGKLKELRFELDGELIPLTNFGACQVACTADGRTIYFIGGNMTVDLDALSIPTKDYAELGPCPYIEYNTQKGFHNFQKMGYWHEFGEESGELPTLLYDSINRVLFLAGGNYEVLPAGITN